MELAPLTLAQVVDYVADALREPADAVPSLAEPIFAKTAGNPFFIVQFLTMLNDEGALEFDDRSGRWNWDPVAIRAKSITDRVGDLITEKLRHFDDDALKVLTRFAVLGQTASRHSLARVLGYSETAVDSALRPFVDADLVYRLSDEYAFAYGGVRDAAYARLDDDERPAAHLETGRLLAEDLGDRPLQDGAFEIANQFNRGIGLVTDDLERNWLAELNLIAGRRAKAANAYAEAIKYLDAARMLLRHDRWEENYRLCFDLELNRADCEFGMGRSQAAETAYLELATRSQPLSDLARVVGRQMIVLTYAGRSGQSIDLALDCLERMGVRLPRAPVFADVEREYRAVETRICGREVDALISGPSLTDPHWIEIQTLLEELLGPVAAISADFVDVIALRMVRISLDHGCSELTSHALAVAGTHTLGWRVGSFHDGENLCKLALRIVDELGFVRYASRTYTTVASNGHWSRPLRACYALAQRAATMPRDHGGIGFTGYAWISALSALIGCGERLNEIERQCDEAAAVARTSKFSLNIEFVATQRLLVTALRGPPNGHDAALVGFSDAAHEAYLESLPNLAHAMVRYYVRKLQFLVYAGRPAEGVAILEKLGGNPGQSPLLLGSPVFEVVEYSFFSALARAEVLSSSPADTWICHFEALKISGAQLASWAERCPENFADRAALIAAEIAQLEGRVLDAEGLYEEAIRLARAQGHLHIEGLARECAGRFHEARRLETVALAYLRGARECYELWGANAKVRQFDARYPRVAQPQAALDGSGGRMPQFDLQALVGMYQALSQEIVLESLIERLMALVVEHAGAVRGLLLLWRDGEMRIVAEAISLGGTVRLAQREFGTTDTELPISILNYVFRTQQPVIIDDARETNPHGHDIYIVSAKPRSVLCLPLIKQQSLVGALYLENDLASHIFTPDRLSLLQMLASQAAISIQNAELFRDVQGAQEQARKVSEELRRNFDLMPVMAWRAAPDGAFEIANKRWYEYTGLSDVEEISLLDPFHPDDVGKVAERWAQLRTFSVSGEVEARLRRSDGQFRSFLIRAAPVRDASGNVVEWHGTNTDIEDLKRAEEAQEALARVSRLTAMGELTVSIAHEVNQPLMAIVTNAASCLRWLGGNAVNLVEARAAAERIIRDGHRAGDVIASIRAMAQKAPPKLVPSEINAVISEVLVLVRNELERHNIVVETRFADDAGPALIDRVQIQQVMLNLVMNAIEAMDCVDPARRALTVRTERRGEEFIRVAVSDTGTGIVGKDAGKVFDAFFTTKNGGVGMGLSICRSIIEAHGGRLSMADNEPVGCVFDFELRAVVE